MKRLCIKLFAVLGLLLVSANASALEVTAEGGTVTATTEDGRTWEHTILDKENYPDAKLHVLKHNNHVYACGTAMIYQLDGYNGSVHWRRALPYNCTALELKEGKVIVTAADKYGWREKKPTHTYEVTSSGVNAPFTMGQNLVAFLPRKQADALLGKDLGELISKKMAGTEFDLTQESRATAEAAIDALGRAAAADPTNPWFRLRRGQVYALLGNESAARESYESIFKLAKPYQRQLLIMTRELDEIDPKLGDRAFDMAMTSLLEAGFEPNLNSSLISVMIWLGRPPGADDNKTYDLAKPEDLAILERRGNRLAQFAPRSEGATHFYNALYEAAEKRGDAEGAKKWKQLRDDSYPYRVFGGPARDAAASGDWLNVYLAAGAIFWLLLLVKLARSGFDRVPPNSSKLVRWNLFNRLTHGEILGMFALIFASLYTLRKVASGVAIIGVMASMPVGMLGGTLGHPDSELFFGHYNKESKERTLVLGISAQQAGEVEEARKLYTSLPDNARAQNNLGVLEKMAGNEDAAKKHWEKALALDANLDIAKYNLGQEVTGMRFEQQKRLAPKLPIIASPSQDQWSNLWKNTAELDAWVNPLAVFELADNVSSEDSALKSWLSAAPAALLALLMMAFMLVALFKREEIIEHETKKSLPGWALTSLLPGGSRHYSVAGPLVALLFTSSAVAAYTLATTEGMATNILMAIAVPAFTKYFGVSQYFHGPDETFWRQMASYWWVFLLANVVFVGVMEKLRPDPNGPFAKTKK